MAHFRMQRSRVHSRLAQLGFNYQSGRRGKGCQKATPPDDYVANCLWKRLDRPAKDPTELSPQTEFVFDFEIAISACAALKI